MQETLARLTAHCAAAKLNEGPQRGGEPLRDEKSGARTASAYVRALEERCAAIDRIFAYEAGSLVDSSLRRR